MRALAAAALPFLVSALPAQSGLSVADVMKVRTVTGVYPSPDGTTVAFTRTEPRPQSEVGSARNHLWLIEEGGERLLIGGTQSASGVAWHPTAGHLTVVHKGKDDKHPEVYSIALDGQMAKVTDTPHGVGAYKWRPDGGAIAYVARDPLSEARARASKMGFKQRIVDEDYRHTSLWLWVAATGDNEKLTDDVTVNSFEWAPTSTHLAAGIAPSSLVDDRYMFTRLHVVDPAHNTVELLVDNPGKLGDYGWSPDGKTLAYISAADRNDPHAGMLYTVALDNREPRALTPGFKGMIQSLEWIVTEEGPVIGALTAEGVRSVFAGFDPATGGVIRPNKHFEGVAIRSWAPAGAMEIYAVASDAKSPNEVWRLQVTDEDRGFSLGASRVTDSNPWLADRAFGEQQVVRFAARDGLTIEGLLLYPVGYQEGTRYPMVVVAHGGPEAHFSHGWNTDYGRWGQLLCARGYFAWYPNYRASTGYGVEFAKADHGDPMGSEFEDHLDAIAHLAEAGLIDRERVGIGGGSYGGYTAAWAATKHSDHFAAAVSFVPFVDIRTKWYTSDIPYEFYFVHYEEMWPHEQSGFLADRSPLSYADRCRTPLLLLGGTQDTRVHPSQPFMLYRAVKFATDTPVRYVQYPGEGHGNRSNVYQYDYALRTLRWFDHYVKGGNRQAPPPSYDVDYGGWGAEPEGEKKSENL